MTLSVFGPLVLVVLTSVLFGPTLLEITRPGTANTPLGAGCADIVTVLDRCGRSAALSARTDLDGDSPARVQVGPLHVVNGSRHRTSTRLRSR